MNDETNELLLETYEDMIADLFIRQRFAARLPLIEDGQIDLWVREERSKDQPRGNIVIMHGQDIAAVIELSLSYDDEDDTVTLLIDAVHLRRSIGSTNLASLLMGLDQAFVLAMGDFESGVDDEC